MHFLADSSCSLSCRLKLEVKTRNSWLFKAGQMHLSVSETSNSFMNELQLCWRLLGNKVTASGQTLLNSYPTLFAMRMLQVLEWPFQNVGGGLCSPFLHWWCVFGLLFWQESTWQAALYEPWQGPTRTRAGKTLHFSNLFGWSHLLQP